MTQFEYLFSPLKIGPIEVKNRIVCPPHTTSFRRSSEQCLAYHEARAKGGAGAITLQGSGPVQGGVLTDLYIESEMAGFRRICDALHKHGAKAFLQMANLGAFWGPSVSSGVPHAWMNIQPRQFTTREMEELVRGYGDAAARAKSLGVDGVEVQCTHGTAIQQAVSSAFNYRTDKYGGNFENRLRYLLEIIDSVRGRIGPGTVLGVRMDVDESQVGGHSLEGGVEICKILAKIGKVDYFSIDVGIEPQEGYLMIPSSYLPQTPMLYAAAAVRKAVDIPVLGVGRINTPQLAERALAEGQLDLVGVCRGFIADPEWANKAKRGDTDDIRLCIGDVEGCYGRNLVHVKDGMPREWMGCTVNPDIGREHKAALVPAEKKKHVVIVGAGVSGMQAAMIAARRGHKVTLLEKEASAGGHVKWLSKLPGKVDVEEIARWLGLQLKKLSVDIRLNTAATPDLIQSLKPDAVVIAAGSHYDRKGVSSTTLRAVPGVDATYVLTPEDVLNGAKPVGQHVVIFDDTGYIVGPGLAELLGEQGKNVEIVTSKSMLASTVEATGVARVLNTRVMAKAKVICDYALQSIVDHTVNLTNFYTGEQKSIKGVDTVILLTGKCPEEKLFQELEGKVPELYIIGDANRPRLGPLSIDAAIKDGDAIGRKL